jgi:hypothetical protein
LAELNTDKKPADFASKWRQNQVVGMAAMLTRGVWFGNKKNRSAVLEFSLATVK